MEEENDLLPTVWALDGDLIPFISVDFNHNLKIAELLITSS